MFQFLFDREPLKVAMEAVMEAENKNSGMGLTKAKNENVVVVGREVHRVFSSGASSHFVTIVFDFV